MLKKLLFYSMPVLKVLLFAVFLILCSIPFGLLTEMGVIDDEKMNPLAFDLLSETIVVLVVISALLMCFRVFKQYYFDNIFIVKRNIISGFAKGTGIGTAIILLCVGIAFFAGNVSFSWGHISILFFFGYLLLYILVGVFEEFIFRSFPLLVFAERYQVALAILLTSSLFGMAHFANPGFTWLAMINITLAGALFSIIILLKRNIYWAIGIHFGWNFTQGTVLGYKVSGTDPIGVLVAKPVGADYLSGGKFGIEGSVYCSIILLILIAFLLIRYTIEPIVIVDTIDTNEEMATS
jgi:membrane protease YdiL (CAAX protease family)